MPTVYIHFGQYCFSTANCAVSPRDRSIAQRSLTIHRPTCIRRFLFLSVVGNHSLHWLFLHPVYLHPMQMSNHLKRRTFSKYDSDLV